MLRYLSRVSLWLAALAAAASLFTPGVHGATLASVAMLALIGSFVLRRFELKAAVLAQPEPDVTRPLDDVALLDACVVLARGARGASTLASALREVRDGLIHELGAHGVIVHEAQPDSPLVIAERFPLGDAARSGIVAGSVDRGFALPVLRQGRVVALVEIAGTELKIEHHAMVRLLDLVKLQLETVAERDASTAPAADGALAQGGAPEGDEKLLSLLAETLPASLFVFSVSERRLLAVNRYAEMEFGLDRRKIIGKTLEQAFSPQVARAAEPPMLEAIRSATTVDVDCEWDTRAGVRRTVNLRSVVLRHLDGRPRVLLTLARNISDERRDRRELEETQARFTELCETMDDVLFVGNPERTKFEFVSHGVFDVFGVTRERFETVQASVLDHVIEADLPLLHARMERERRGESVDVTYRLRHPAKGLRWIRSRSRARCLPDGSVRVFGLVSDVTHECEHEKELEQARDAAEAASLAKSQFMANMSHEIRTPMNGILGMTELLLGTPLNERQRRFAQAVYRSGESLLEIINDILDFSKIEAGKLELAPTNLTLRGVVEDTLELLAPRAHEKGLELSFHEAPCLPAHVHADPLRLRQVLTNLVANAIKFTECGEVVVELQPADAPSPSRKGLPDGDGDGDGEPVARDEDVLWLRFNVRDTGIGIDADALPRLFKAFTQANGGMSRRYGGTGLGLAISRQLIELMGGSIGVESAPGIGSKFSFVIPVRKASREVAAVDSETEELGALRVLVVEDHETNRVVLENMLSAWGMTVTLAHDGQHALDIVRGRTLQDTHHDLALVDMNMPRLDGISFGRALRSDGMHPDMKLILLSSVSSPDDARAAQLAGFDRFVAKPVRKAELRQAILGVSAARREAVSGMPRLSGRVLVVEDNSVNQEVIAQMLRQLGLTVRVAGGALQGLRALCEAHFDLVLMDIQMPGMDGVEALGWFRRGSGDRFEFTTPFDTPVIAVTANALGGDQDRFLALGFDDYLSKPFRQSQLLAMLTKRLTPSCGEADGRSGDGGAQPAASPGRPADGVAPSPAAAAPAADSGSMLDAASLDRLRDLDPKGENQLISRVCKAFETSAARLLPQMIDAERAADWSGVRHVAHTMKSSSASIGALKLSQLCADIETKIRTDQLENLHDRLEAMCAEVEIVLQALKRLLDPPP